jgi:hypothetical protein
MDGLTLPEHLLELFLAVGGEAQGGSEASVVEQQNLAAVRQAGNVAEAHRVLTRRAVPEEGVGHEPDTGHATEDRSSRCG